MTLYTKKKGEYVEMTRAQIRRLRRVDTVSRVDKTATRLARSTRALAVWLHAVDLQFGRLTPDDLTMVVNAPNAAMLKQLCDDADAALKELRSV